MPGTANHPGADPNQREYGGDIPQSYARCMAINPGVMREKRSDAGNEKRHDTENGQDEWKRHQPGEKKSRSCRNYHKDRPVDVPCRDVEGELGF
jgi:hypothetical protein